MSDEVIGREQCPSCVNEGRDAKGDNLARYADGHAHCFACDYHEHGAEGADLSTSSSKPLDFQPIDFTPKSLSKRGVSLRTCEKYEYGVATDDFGNPIQVCNVRDPSGRLVQQKVRTKDKDFYSNGKAERTLIGLHLWRTGGKRIVITEGEIDMLSYAEVVDCKWPVVSLPNGAKSAKKAITNCMQELQRFDEVVLMFDNDEAGQEAVEAVLPLFRPNHAKVATLPLKDANDMLVAGREKELISAVFNAEVYRPSEIVTVEDIYDQALVAPTMGISLPWPTATKVTLGVRRGEIHIVGAAPKIGKTEHQHQLIKHFTDVENERVGVMSLEEHPVKTLKKVAGKYATRQFTKPKEIGGWTDAELRQAMDGLKDKIVFYSSKGERDHDVILNTIRWWAAEGIWLFIVDPLTALVAELEGSAANDALNEFMSKAASMCMELGVTIFMYSHVNPVKYGIPHDQGGKVLSSQFTGSRAMEKWAHYGWGISRNRNDPDPVTRNTATVSLLFDREFGEYCEYKCFYDQEKNDWSEVPDGFGEGFKEEAEEAF